MPAVGDLPYNPLLDKTFPRLIFLQCIMGFSREEKENQFLGTESMQVMFLGITAVAEIIA